MFKRDVKEVNSSKLLFVPEDKTTHFYKVNIQGYKKLLLNIVAASNQKSETGCSVFANKYVFIKLVMSTYVKINLLHEIK